MEIHSMRAFISINLSPEIQSNIRDFQHKLTNESRGVRWTRPENCHLTLQFLGDTPEPVAESLTGLLEPAVSSFDPFTVELKGIGQFPPRGPLSVLWVGVQSGRAALLLLEQAIRSALDNAGVSYDRKPFSPHLTIGRAKRGEKPVVRNFTEYKEYSLGMLSVEGFYLMESVLKPSGPVYSIRRRFAFNL